MNRRNWQSSVYPAARRSLAIAVAATAVLLAPGARGQMASEGRGERFRIELQRLTTPRDERRHEGATVSASSGCATEPGEACVMYQALGSFDPTDRADIDRSGSSNGTVFRHEAEARLAELLGTYPLVWWVEATALPAEFGRVAFDVAWERLEAGTRGDHRPVAGGRRRIELREGARHVLDFVAFGAGSAYQNAVLQIELGVEEDPALAGERLRYDLWYRHREPNGAETARRFASAGLQGETVEFRFVPLRYGVPGARLGDGSGVDTILEISGTVQGRVRADGTIDLELRASRWVDAEPAGSPRRGGIGDGGSKQLNLRPGETVSLVLRAPGGTAGVSRSGASADHSGSGAPRMEVNVDMQEFFAGHEDSLILTVTREG